MESLILGSAASFVENIQGKQQPEVERHVKREDAAPHVCDPSQSGCIALSMKPGSHVSA